MEANIYVPFLAALIPLVVGAVYYNPKVLGTAWMRAAEVTEEKLAGGNMAVIFGLAYVLSLLIAFSMVGGTIHQFALNSILLGEAGMDDPNSDLSQFVNEFMDKYGRNHRNFGHGAFHGFFSALLYAVPIVAINAMFERRGFKYIAIHAGYWIIALTLMAGIISAFM